MTSLPQLSAESPSPVPTVDGGWDRLVADLPGGSIYQTTMWAEAKGHRTESYIVRTEPGSAVGLGGAQILVRRLGPGIRAASVPYGPVGERQATSPDDLAPLMSAIEQEARAAGCSVLLIQPARGEHRTAEALAALGYTPSPVEIAVSAALEVELGRPGDEIFGDLGKSRRRNVRRAERRGVTVEFGSRDDLPALLELHNASAQRHGFSAMSRPYIERQWDALAPGGHMQLFLARLDDRVVAAGTMIGFGPLAEFKLTGWDGSERAQTRCVNEALNWAMMAYANEAGYRTFDLGGLPRDQALKAQEGDVDSVIRGTGSEFKHGWGGKVVVHPAPVQKILSRRGQVTYGLASRLLGDTGWRGRLVNWIRRT